MPSLMLLLAAWTPIEDQTYLATLDCAILATVSAEWLAEAEPARAGGFRDQATWAMKLVRAHPERNGMTETQAVAFVGERAQGYRDRRARSTNAVSVAAAPARLGAQADALCTMARKGWEKAG